jgi:hypothetical protein
MLIRQELSLVEIIANLHPLEYTFRFMHAISLLLVILWAIVLYIFYVFKVLLNL